MLHTLHLKNFALIDEYELTLNDGFNVITGETGAGKSLILDALSLCMGGRGGSDLVRFGEKTAEIVAYFDHNTPQISHWFKKQDREFDDEIVIRRQITDSGRSKAWINGVPASLSELKSLGGLLVNIHSQHAGLDLLKPHFVITWLDTVAGITDKAKTVRMAFSAWQKLHEALMTARDESNARLDRINLLQSKLADIEPLLKVDMTAINARYDELSNIETLTEDAFIASNMLDADGDEPSALTLMGRVMKLCENHSDISPAFSSALDSLSEAYELTKETWATLSDYANTASFDTEELAELNTLMSLAHRLSSKYRTPIEELIADSATWQSELDTLSALSDPDMLEKKAKEAFLSYKKQAEELHELRLASAETICRTMEKKLAPLALPNAQCEFTFTRSSPKPMGLYDIELLFSANVGLPKQPLHKVASGGELSRVALVMQVMSAKMIDSLPLLVFDEVDVGISGGTAQVVGELLRDLGTNQQLIAITHQAQVAACGHCHILVKKQHDNKTTSHISILENDERIGELARMSGGVNITTETLAHAKSLLTTLQK